MMLLRVAAATIIFAEAAHGLRRDPAAAIPTAGPEADVPTEDLEDAAPTDDLETAVPDVGNLVGCARLPSLARELHNIDRLYLKWSEDLDRKLGWKGGKKYNEFLSRASHGGYWTNEERHLEQARELNFTGRLYPNPFSPESIWNASHQGYKANKYPLHRALHKFLSGQGLELAVIGGSFTASENPACLQPWPHRLAESLTALRRRILPRTPHSGVSVNNLARTTTTTRRVIMTWGDYRQNLSSADLVLSEYSLNDQMLIDNNGDYGGGAGMAVDLANKMLIQELDRLPGRPGLVYFDLPNPFKTDFMDGEEIPVSNKTQKIEEAWEGPHFDVAKELAVPVVWYTDAVRSSGGLYMDMNISGPNQTIREHPMCFPGQTTMAYAMYGVLLQEMHEVCSAGLPPAQPLGVHLDGGRANVSDLFECVMKPTFDAHARNDSKKFNVVSKDTPWKFWADVAYRPGWIAPPGAPAEIVFGVYTAKGIVQVEYLQTYENIGSARCVLEDHGIGVGELEMNGLWDRHASRETVARMVAKVRPGDYNLRCTSDGKKFKITAVLAC